MAIRDIFKVSRKTFFDPASWSNYNGMKDMNRSLFAMLGELFTPEKPLREETFEEAMARLALTPEEVEKRKTLFRQYTWIFFGLGVILFLYAFYLIIVHHTIAGFVLAFATSLLFLVQAFRFDFWAFQIHSQRLGVSFKEWRQHFFAKSEHKS